MDDAQRFGLLILIAAVVGLLAVSSTRLSARLHVPAPALFLAAAALAAAAVPSVHAPPHRTVERLVTVALVIILFEGGMHLGVRRVRAAATAIALVGVVGTFLTAAVLGVLAHAVLGVGWYAAVLVGTALAPTDPAVVFSVLGGRQIEGRSGTLLEGESGANDPVGIALMAALLLGGGLARGVTEFLLQMGIGAAVGVVGGVALRWLMRSVPLPDAGLYPLRVVAAALVVYGAGTVAHGSGFLAVFVAGIVIGDTQAPYREEIEHFSSSLAALAEIVAFILLGLTIQLGDLASPGVWATGLALGATLAFVIRPLLVGLVLWPLSLERSERLFVLWCGLRGAVPILLGTFIATSEVADRQRLYGVVVVVVAFSVVVQGGLVPTVARWCRLPMTPTGGLPAADPGGRDDKEA